MKRLTTDAPKDNIETALNLFYIKDRETWVRGGGPAPEFKDVTLDNYMRSLIKAHIPTAEVPEGAADFSMMMAEWLFDDADTAEGTLATLYAAAWAFAELRCRLMLYEDALPLEEVERLMACLKGSAVARSDLGKRLAAAQQELHEVKSELGRVKAEKDAAIADLKKIAESGRVWMCPYCAHNKGIYRGMCHCELSGSCAMPYTCFKWRGMEAEAALHEAKSELCEK